MIIRERDKSGVKCKVFGASQRRCNFAHRRILFLNLNTPTVIVMNKTCSRIFNKVHDERRCPPRTKVLYALKVYVFTDVCRAIKAENTKYLLHWIMDQVFLLIINVLFVVFHMLSVAMYQSVPWHHPYFLA